MSQKTTLSTNFSSMPNIFESSSTILSGPNMGDSISSDVIEKSLELGLSPFKNTTSQPDTGTIHGVVPNMAIDNSNASKGIGGL